MPLTTPEIAQPREEGDSPFVMEPELAKSNMPRPVYMSGDTMATRFLLWTVWLFVTVIIINLGMRDYEAVRMLPNSRELSLVPSIIIFVIATVFFVVIIAVKEREWRRQIYLLREGIAVRGRVCPGKKVGSRNFCLDISFLVGGKTWEEQIDVTLDQYYRFTSGNSYYTVLYERNDPGNCLLYRQIEAAQLTKIFQ